MVLVHWQLVQLVLLVLVHWHLVQLMAGLSLALFQAAQVVLIWILLVPALVATTCSGGHPLVVVLVEKGAHQIHHQGQRTGCHRRLDHLALPAHHMKLNQIPFFLSCYHCKLALGNLFDESQLNKETHLTGLLVHWHLHLLHFAATGEHQLPQLAQKDGQISNCEVFNWLKKHRSNLTAWTK